MACSAPVQRGRFVFERRRPPHWHRREWNHEPSIACTSWLTPSAVRAPSGCLLALLHEPHTRLLCRLRNVLPQGKTPTSGGRRIHGGHLYVGLRSHQPARSAPRSQLRCCNHVPPRVCGLSWSCATVRMVGVHHRLSSCGWCSTSLGRLRPLMIAPWCKCFKDGSWCSTRSMTKMLM